MGSVKDAVRVRVSLGLKPQFERTLFWHPGKPASQAADETVALKNVPDECAV